ncbi:hypothetical protein MBCUT_08250 [Methanobrevibacter cuticularis]|uniref:PIN domain-containing protein n=1 Tax=Methanobrevibacter cuticularis TaxID=47311 RepID=A0A166EA75_9EURY|nr:hypothetical protein MBCUT_08250 [Methanobrevibacter cuticularis]
MLDYENKDHPYNEKKDKIQLWKDIATEFCDFHEEIRNKGKELEKLNIKPKDALHIACAIFSKCDYFLTTDYKLINKNIKKINIINPMNFIKIIEE